MLRAVRLIRKLVRKRMGLEGVLPVNDQLTEMVIWRCSSMPDRVTVQFNAAGRIPLLEQDEPSISIQVATMLRVLLLFREICQTGGS
jgi:hypothetical protein